MGILLVLNTTIFFTKVLLVPLRACYIALKVVPLYDYKPMNHFMWLFIGTSNKLEYHEKGQYFWSLISESDTHII